MLNTTNEWGTLKEVVVGVADHANWPTTDPVFLQESEKTLWKETPIPSGPVPQHIIDEANEDLDGLAKILTQAGAKVHRPTEINFQEINGMYNYCPRDRLLIHGSEVVDTAMQYPCRDIEIEALKFVTDRASKVHTMPRDEGMVLDAANIARLGDTWLYLESQSGNRKAYDWLVERFPKINIEICNFYAGVHIDSTITPLREGLVLVNGSRVNKGNLPKALKDWEIIYVDEVVPQGFYKYPYASKWIALNMLAVNPNLAVVDKHQTALIRTLEKHGVDVALHELRHSRTLGGGYHCVTLDMVRD